MLRHTELHPNVTSQAACCGSQLLVKLHSPCACLSGTAQLGEPVLCSKVTMLDWTQQAI